MKRILFISFFLFAFTSIKSFSQNWLWGRSGAFVNSSSYAEGMSTAVDRNGNVYVTGAFSPPSIKFGSITLTTTGLFDVFLTKYDSLGNVLWGICNTDSNISALAFSVVTDTHNNVYVAGGFFSSTITFGTTVLTNNGNENVFLAKYDEFGILLWAKSAGGVNSDEGYSLTSDIGDNIYLTGSFSSPTITFGTTILTNFDPVGTTADVYITKYDANGNVLWANSAGQEGNDGGYGVSATNGGYVFLSGCFESQTIFFGTFTLNYVGGQDIFLAKYDSIGNVIWAKSAGGGYMDAVYSASADPFGDVFITGYFISNAITFNSTTLSNSYPLSGGSDFFITKYDSNGNILWARSSIGVNSELGYSTSVDAYGNVYVSGTFDSPTVSFESETLSKPPLSFEPLFIVKYSRNGDILCASVLSSGGDDQNGLSADIFGNVYVGGDYITNPFIVGSDTFLLTTGGEQVFVAKYRCGLGNTEPSNPISPCQNIFVPTAFSPNNDGANDTLFVRSECIKTLELKIYDRLGEKVFETNDIAKGWDGNYNGEKMNNTVFVYFLEGTFNDGTAFSKKGDFSLIR